MRVVVIGLLALLGLWGLAWGENPKVSLKVESATLPEAVAQLSTAADVPLELYNPVPVPGQVAPERVTFDWTNVSLATALRQLCEKYSLRPTRRQGGGYLLYQNQGGLPAGKLVGLVEKNGVRLFARGISIYEHRSIGFTAGAPNASSSGNGTLQLGCQVVDGDGDSIAGVASVIAKDDLGNVMTFDPQRGQYQSDNQSQLPDEWSGYVSLGSVHPKARRLVSVEGDLLAYRSVRPLKVEIPLPLPEKTVRREAGDLLIVASRYQVLPKPEPEPEEDDLPQIGGRPSTPDYGPSLRVRLFVPANGRTSARSGSPWNIAPYVIGASGRVYPGQQLVGRGATGNGQMTVYDTTWIFPMDEAPAKIGWDLVERADPERLLSFRMTDIPLPDPPAVPGRLAAPPPPLPRDTDTSRPYYQKGGGILVSQVLLGDRPASGGLLALGLAEKTGAGWGPTRWVNVGVGPNGIARLEDVKPGAYRLKRVYTPRTPPADDAPKGRWHNDEVTVQVPNGKEVTPPALKWTAK